MYAYLSSTMRTISLLLLPVVVIAAVRFRVFVRLSQVEPELSSSIAINDPTHGDDRSSDGDVVHQDTFRVGVPLRGGTLPIRRFMVCSGVHLASIFEGAMEKPAEKAQLAVEWCNDLCHANPVCDAWQLSTRRDTDKNTTSSKPGHKCDLYADGTDEATRVGVWQATQNDPSFVIGLLQRHARVLRAKAVQLSQANVSERILYILHSHHVIQDEVYSLLMGTILPSHLPHTLFDVTVITPHAISLPLDEDSSSVTNATSLINPFKKSMGTNSHMSMPIASSKFPGYKGYLQVNDDAVARLWDFAAKSSLYLGESPWGTFPYRTPGMPLSSAEYRPREFLPRYPYGSYPEPWVWWHLDSGYLLYSKPRNRTRSNFEAALGAVNEFCADSELKSFPPTTLLQKELCTERQSNILTPMVRGYSDAFYVPGTLLGDRISRTLALFGEHDVMLEIAVPMAYIMNVPDDMLLNFSHCDTHVFDPIPFQTKKEKLKCPIVHPVKFSKAVNLQLWKSIVEEECRACPSWGVKKEYWKIVAYHDPDALAPQRKRKI